MEMSTHTPAPAAANGAGGPPDLEVAVIGAGPHGLSAATHLRRAGVKAHVFGSPMGFWKTMPEGMKLRSNLSATSMVETVGPLSLSAYAEASGAQIGQPVELSDFIEYGSWVQRTAVPDLDERTVTALERAPAGFSLELDDGTRVSARRVVIACGIAPFERIPAGFEQLPAERVSHTAHHRDLGAFAGQRVAVVGGGQSAFESAALMRERGAAHVEVLVRRDAVVWLRGHGVKKILGRLGPIVYAPTDVGPLWYSRLVERPDLFRHLPREAQDRIAARSIRPACSHFVRVRLGEITISTGVEVRGAQADGGALRVSLSDGSAREVDHLMFGTGYKVDVSRYAFLGEGILAGMRRVDGYPVLGRGLETSVAGLHMVGAPAAWSFGPINRFVSGSWYAGRAVAREIAGRASGHAVGGVRS
ncbi:MAG: FAD-dependent oxidoreductase [Solirubrobacteraceae bacterium]